MSNSPSASLSSASPARSRLRVTLGGSVQGVGFRPFVFRLAGELALDGWVSNSTSGLCIEVEGCRQVLKAFLLRLESEKPSLSFIASSEPVWLEPVGYNGFQIRQSDLAGVPTALILPDIATCPQCIRDVFDPENRRYFYPFTNCTQCGPRYSIVEALPYDRVNTSMRSFQMCSLCQSEYNEPRDRRFHAQPNACPACGPRLQLLDADGKAFTPDPDLLPAARLAGIAHGGHSAKDSNLLALLDTAERIRRGQIAAVKGLGGFHLIVNATDEAAVSRLRDRKHREEKPFALMFPSLTSIAEYCVCSDLETRVVAASEAPILLLERRKQLRPGITPLAHSIAPGNPRLGVMLPYTPLHHLLMHLLGFPVVATSGNLSDEPICTDEHEAPARLGGIADFFLAHDRPIVRQVDDSIVQVSMDREMVLRRARGYAPLPIPGESNRDAKHIGPVLAVGAHLKNTIALTLGSQVFLSQHIGDLESAASLAAFRKVIEDFSRLYAVKPSVVVADLHPDYLSTRFAQQLTASSADEAGERPLLRQVQHHFAHALACIGENELKPPVLGVVWDGTGLGSDHTIWGGEFILMTETGCERIGHFRQFPLPGGDAAIQEPRRTALGLLFELYGEGAVYRKEIPTLRAFTDSELVLLHRMLVRKLNSPLSSSVGRLFDAVASLLDLKQRSHFEGQAAMALEFSLPEPSHESAYVFSVTDAVAPGPFIVDWAAVIESVLRDRIDGVGSAIISSKFHNGLAECIVTVARRVGCPKVALSGGCFQNRYLLESSVRRLQASGFQPYWHQRVPPNDGGISFGQAVAALRGIV